MNLTTKLLLLVSSCAVGLSNGVLYAKSLKSKSEFFKELSSFIDNIINDVTFRQNGIRSIANDFIISCRSQKLKSVLEQYAQNPLSVPNIQFLQKSDRLIVCDFFSGLGKFDLTTERIELENFKAKITGIYDRYKSKCDRQCSVAIKLGLLSGLMIGILML